jgi:riboflavin kinase / FMN adenylyltransferase
MPVETELAEIAPGKDMLLTIGVFDGVHLGHKYLLSKLKEKAAEKNLLPGLITFRQHPRAVLASRAELPYLTGLEEKVRLIKDEGIQTVVVLSFTKELSKLTAREFIELLQKYLRMKGLFVGADFVLGRGREGNTNALRRLGEEMGFSLDVIPRLEAGQAQISSTAIRDALTRGNIKKAVGMTGRPYILAGKVIKGVGRGKGLGFPTANVDVDLHRLLPADGVYATVAYVDGKPYQSVTNIGKNPTFSAERRTVEAFLIDFSEDLYGRELKLDFIERLRGEKKFANVEELKQQMTADVKQGKIVLESVTTG